jgi:hypothetical protein
MITTFLVLFLVPAMSGIQADFGAPAIRAPLPPTKLGSLTIP